VFKNNFVNLSSGLSNFVRGSVATVQRGSALRIENSLVLNNGGNDSMKTPAALFQVGGNDLGSNVEPNVGARLTLLNCLITGNMGDSEGCIVRSEMPTSIGTPTPNVVTLTHCTMGDPQPLAASGSVTGALIMGTYGNLSTRDCILWAPLTPAVAWSGGTALVIHSAIGPLTSTGLTTVANNVLSDPLFDLSGSWLLTPGSPAINAGSSLAQVSGLGMRSALADLTPDTGQVDMGYHAPMPNAGTIAYTSVDAYTLGHQLALHSAYSTPPPP
jgi:hypothetical protein